MKTINDLLQHAEPQVRELGQKAVRYRAQLDQAEISSEEYATLRAQLVDLEGLHSAVVRAEERQAIAQAVEFLQTYLPMAI